MANFKQGLGANLKLNRKLREITQEDLAEIIGIHSRQLSKIETGDHFPSCKTLEKLCMALDLKPRDLFDFEFLIDENESVLTGTDSTPVFRVNKTSKNNIFELFPNKVIKQKTCTDATMSKTAKKMNKPLFVEYFENKKVSKIVVFYPDGTEKVVLNSVDVEAKKNMNFMLKEFKKICKNKAATDFIKLALTSLHSDEDLKKLDNLVHGMKLARGIK